MYIDPKKIPTKIDAHTYIYTYTIKIMYRFEQNK